MKSSPDEMAAYHQVLLHAKFTLRQYSQYQVNKNYVTANPYKYCEKNTALWPLCRAICVSWKPSCKIKDFARAMFNCPPAVVQLHRVPKKGDTKLMAASLLILNRFS